MHGTAVLIESVVHEMLAEFFLLVELSSQIPCFG
ncbi:hypothetical protein ECSTEC7V_1813, partial [Escherichia coli STEC_7v]